MRRRRAVMLEAAVTVLVVAVIKVGAHLLGLEVLELNSLFTSLIGGAIFLFGLILSGTLSDYKESDRVPAEIASALDSIWEEARATAAKNPAYDPSAVRTTLVEIPRRFLTDIGNDGFGDTLASISALTPHFAAMEAAGALPQYISRLRGDQSAIRRLVMRVSHVQRTDFMPSAYNLLLTVVVLVIGILVFTGIEPIYLSVILVSFLTYLFTYVIRLLRLLEQPFRPQGECRDDVSMHLLEEFMDRLHTEE